MFKFSERAFITTLLVVSLVLGVIGYIAAGQSTEPRKVWFDAGGGDLVFDHAFHVSMSECVECHHNYDPSSDEKVEMKCRGCHYYGSANEIATASPHPRGIGASCLQCHEEHVPELTACDACHVHLGYAFMASSRIKVDSPKFVVFDSQNVGAEYDLGPVVFNHNYHRDFGTCSGCHHEYGNEKTGIETGEKKCRECHYTHTEVTGLSEADPHKHFIGAYCVSCHENLGDVMASCDVCHIDQGEDPFKHMRARKHFTRTVEYETDNGKVVFNHRLHVDEDLSISCLECHHEFVGGEGMDGMEDEKSCRACHYKLEDKIASSDADGIHTRYIGNSCGNCHDVEECGTCHLEE
jgi:class III cytochrome C family protein